MCYDLTPDKEILNEYLNFDDWLNLNQRLVWEQMGHEPIQSTDVQEKEEISSLQDYLKNLKTKQKKET